MILVLANDQGVAADYCRNVLRTNPYGVDVAIYTPSSVFRIRGLRILPTDEVIDLIDLGRLASPGQVADAMALRCMMREVGNTPSPSAAAKLVAKTSEALVDALRAENDELRRQLAGLRQEHLIAMLTARYT